MTDSKAENASNGDKNKQFLIGLARAFAGAIIFSFSIILTMEMWWLGFTIEHYRLVIFMALTVPLLTGLSYYIGFESTSTILDDLVDAFVAYAVGFVTSAVMLFIFGIIDRDMSISEIIGKIGIQSIVAAIGAMLAQSQLGGDKKDDAHPDEERKKRNTSYLGELFIMSVGAIFLMMNPAPTEEIILLGFRMSDVQIIILTVFTMIIMHAFVYSVGFRGQEKRRHKQASFWSVFMRFTVVGYALVLLFSVYLLWTFGRTDGLNLEDTLRIAIVMSFPGALGAAASRLIL